MRTKVAAPIVAVGLAAAAVTGAQQPAQADTSTYSGAHCTYGGYTFNADVERIVHSSPAGTVDFGINHTYSPFYNDVTVWVVWDGVVQFNSPTYESGIGQHAWGWPETGNWNFTYKDNAYVKWTFSDGPQSCSIWINASGGATVQNG